MAYQFENLDILCIDDNRHMQQIYWISLSSLGFRKIQFASDGSEALDLMRGQGFDLVFCDLNMVPMSGLEFVKAVRTSDDPKLKEVPVIVVSGNTEYRRVCEARDAGATEFLAKPISIQDLYSRIRAVIERPREFAEGGGFQGPDRRRKRDIFNGQDRRGGGEASTEEAISESDANDSVIQAE